MRCARREAGPPDPAAAPRGRGRKLLYLLAVPFAALSPWRRLALLPAALLLFALLAAADARAQAPPAPTGLALTAGDGQFTATWNASPGAGTYVIRYAPQGRAWAAVFARPGTATSKTIVSSSAITISNGTTYWARIRACAGTATSGANCSALSAQATVTPRAATAPPPTPTVSLSASPNPVTEGSSVTLKATLSAALSKDVTIPVTTTRGTAERGDVPTPNYFMLIPAGETAAATTIATAQDTDTDDETFTLALAVGELPAGVSAGRPNSVTVIIDDDDAPAPPTPTVSLSASPNPVTEGSSVTLKATLSAALSKDVTIPVTTTRGTAERGDVPTPNYFMLIPAGETAAATTIATAQDTDTDDETFTLALAVGELPAGVSAGRPNSVTVIIDDDDAPAPPTPTVSLSASPNPVTEGSSVTLKATLSAALSKDVTIPVTTTRGTAERGDVPTPNYFMLIPAGETAAATTIATAQDTDTDDETFTLALAVGELPAGVSAGRPNSVTVIIDDDDAPAPPTPTVSLSASPNPVTEGSSVTLKATLSAALSKDVTIPVTTTRGTAERGDVPTPNYFMLIPAGETAAATTIATAQDTDTDDETFTLALAVGELPAGVSAGRPNSVTVIIDDDDAPAPPTPTVSLSASPNPVTEGSSVTLKATLSAALSKDVTIPVTTTRGTAERGDVPTPNYFMLIPAGETAAATTIATAQDTDTDDETFTLALAVGELPAGVSAGRPNSVTVIIDDDDTPALSSDANLSALTASKATRAAGTYTGLTFGNFSADRLTYHANVGATITHVKLTPTSAHGGASIKVGKGAGLTAVNSGTESGAVALVSGAANGIRVEVTAEDGTTKKVYTVVVQRGASDTVEPPDGPSGLALTPGDGKLAASWTASLVQSGVVDAPTRYELIWYESTVASPGWAGSHVRTVTGNPPATDYEITGLTNGTGYRVRVRACNAGGCSLSESRIATPRAPTRTPALSSDASLSGLTLSSGTLAFSPGTLRYSVEVANEVASLVVTPTASDGGASVTVNGGPPGAAVALGAGETVVTVLVTAADGTTVRTYEVTVTRAAAPSSLTLSAAPAPAEGGGVVTVTAILDAAAPQGGTVVALALSGTAEGGGTDYRLSSPTIAIAAGETQGTATIAVVDDAENDPGETIVIDASSVNPALTADPLTLTIADNDKAVATALTLRAAPAPAEGGGAVTVTAALNGPAPEGGTVVTLSVGAASTATDADYRLLSTIIRIAADETSGTAVLSVIDDAVDDDGETIVLSATSDAPALTADPLTLTIADNDAVPASLRLASSPAPAEGGGVVTVTAILDAAAPQGGTVVALALSGTAEGGGVDYTLSSATIAIAAGETQGTTTVTIVDDAVEDPGETIVIDASSVNPALTADPLTLTIADNDAAVATALTLRAAPAPAEGGGAVTVTALLDAAAPRGGTVVALALSGTAEGGGVDYTLSSATIAIAAGATQGTATVTIVDDAVEDPGETIVIDASSVNPALTADPLTLTIADNDKAMNLMPSFGTATVADRSFMAGTAITALLLPAAAGGDGALSYRLTPALPPGLVLDAATRTLRGTPTEPRGSRQYTWTATDADGDSAMLTFALAVTEDARPAEVEEAVKRALAALARRAMAGALDNIGARFADIGASGMSLAGRRVPLEGGAAQAAMAEDAGLRRCAADRRPADGGASGAPAGCAPAGWSRSMTAAGLFGASGFSLHLGASGGEDGVSTPAAALWSVWGGGDLGTFAGRGAAGLGYDGRLRTGWLGVDARSGSWVAGLAVSRDEGEADYGFAEGALAGRGRLEAALTSVYPYGRWTLDDGLELRAVVGAGWGEARHKPEAGKAGTGGLSMRMASLGVRRALPNVAGMALALRADASVTRIETGDGPEAIHGLSADSWRLRAGLEASRRIALAGDGAFEPFFEAAARRDGGDDLEGSGVELAGGLRWRAPGVSVEAHGRWLAMHSEDGAEEKGASLTARVGPGADGRGLFFSLAPRWGAATGAARALWNEEMPNPAASDGAAAVDARVGYGMALFGGRFTGTPNLGFGLSDGGARDYRLGWRLNSAVPGDTGFEVSLDATRHEAANDNAPPEHGVMLRSSIRW